MVEMGPRHVTYAGPLHWSPTGPGNTVLELYGCWTTELEGGLSAGPARVVLGVEAGVAAGDGIALDRRLLLSIPVGSLFRVTLSGYQTPSCMTSIAAVALLSC